jgi:hypothetical protein
MYYVGVDLHKETSWFYIVDSQGKKYTKHTKNLKKAFQTNSKAIYSGCCNMLCL